MKQRPRIYYTEIPAFVKQIIEAKLSRGKPFLRRVIAEQLGIDIELFLMPAQQKVKLADKPGSVVDSHSSRRFVT